MRKVYRYFHSCTKLLIAFLCLFILVSGVSAATQVSGSVYDLTGTPLPQAMVSLTTGAEHQGADVITVFTDAQGRFNFPQSVGGINDPETPVNVKVLGYEQLRVSSVSTNDALELTVIMRSTPNYAAVAPASAWLAGMNPAKMEQLVNSCVGCHQVPGPEVRAYAKQVAAVTGADPAAIRKESWIAMVKYMNYTSAEEFGRGASSAPPDANRVYGVGDGGEIADILYNHFTGPLQELDAYQFGAPLAVTPDTVIMEYEVPRPNAIREAVLGGTPPKLWAADVSSNRMFSIDIATGKQEVHEVPFDQPVGPHSMHRAKDGSLWITPFFSAVLSHLDPDKKTFQTWPLRTKQGTPVGIHDLSFGYEHELLTDKKGRIWFSDIGNNAVGYLDPKTGVIENYKVPEIPGRPGNQAALYGLVMTADRTHIWYSQVGIGSFGSFNVETLKFEQSVQLPSINSGPRRLSISDKDVLYVPLYGAGQLVEYDTRAGKQIGIYDLPDRGSAPYSVTWDPKRKVVWIPTSNADVIYRFDPATKQTTVLPLPRAGAFLRMVDVDPKTGVLVTAYGNIVEHSPGPRMALLIDPGDHVYQKEGSAVSSLISTARN